MRISITIIVYIFLLTASGCKEDEEPKKNECGCESEKEADINNVKGKIEFNTSEQPVSYTLYGYGTALVVCKDSVFERLLEQNNLIDGDSIVFSGDAKHYCTDCEFCGLIKITSLSK
jgi:hypothetical protein